MSERRVLNIADIHIELTSEYPEVSLNEMEQYFCSSIVPPDIRITYKVAEHLSAMDFAEHYTKKNIIEKFGAYGEAFYSQDRNGSKWIKILRNDPVYSGV